MDSHLLDYIYHHVIFPPKLPQRSDDVSLCLGRELLKFVRNMLKASPFIARSSPQTRALWQIATNMLDTWLEVSFGGTIDAGMLTQIITNLKTHGATALYLKSQNCGWIAYYDGEHDNVIIDAFEVSPNSSAVLASKGPLVRCFPGQSVAIPYIMVQDPKFCAYLADALSRLAGETVPDMMPKSGKAGNLRPEERDTIHPALVTEGLMAQLPAFGTRNKEPSFEKHMQDDVNWDSCKIPWRRSPHWTVLRVALQTILQRAFPDCEGRVQYKNFLLYLMAEIGVKINRPSTTPDQLAAVRLKIGRRISKLKEKTHGFVADYAQSSERRIMDTLHAIQRNIVKSDRLHVPPHFPPTHEEHLWMTLKHSRYYLKSVLRQTPAESEVRPFDRQYDHRNARNAFGLPIVEVGSDLLSLADMELWVDQHLANWVVRVQPSEDHFCSLAELLKKYAKAAAKMYSGNPEEESSMLLVILELWMAIDILSTTICPLLKDYEPEIPDGFLEPLLLPRLSQMKRASRIERHIRSRREQARYLPSILGDSQSKSFAVRYFDASDNHKALRERIEQHVSEERKKKKVEFDILSKKYEELIAQASQLDHNLMINGDGEQCHSVDGPCKKCDLEQKASHLAIEVYELPLPADENALKNVVFELACPRWLTLWRDVTWQILHDFGRHQKAQYSEMEQGLLEYRSLENFCVNWGQRLSLGSMAKPAWRSHYRYRHFPVKDFEEILFLDVHKFKLLDREKDLWVGDQRELPTLKPRCTFTISLQPYSHLQYALQSFRHTENGVIADQRNCHASISVHEFIAFGCLRAGERTQWHNMLRELASPALSMNEEPVALLFAQAAWELGSYRPETELREAHQVFKDVSFGAQLVEMLECRLRSIESNWNEHGTLYVLVILGLRLHSLSCFLPIVDRTEAFLRQSRQVAMRWCQALITSLDSLASSDITVQEVLILKICMICQLTYAVELQYLPFVLSSPEDLMILVWSSMMAYDHTPRSNQLPATTKALLLRIGKVLHYVGERARELIEENASGLNNALKIVAPNIQVSGPWYLCDGNLARWVTNRTQAGPHGRQQNIHYDLLSGELLLDNRPPGRLPAEYTGDPLYQRIFGICTMRVVPSNLPGTTFMSVQQFEGLQVHFGMEGTRLIVKAQDSSRLLQLIPHEILLGDFPSALVAKCVHWLDLENGVLEFRPLNQLWESSPDNWRMSFDCNGAYQSIMKRGGRTLVDIYSSLFQQVTSVLSSLDASEHIHMIQAEDGTIEVDVTRLHLRFFVNQDGVLESQEHGATVDQNQDLGCLYGLKNKLILLDSNEPSSRTVLIPFGQIHMQRNSRHSLITIEPPESPTVTYFSYTFDPHIQALRDSSGMLGALHLAYLHAVTGFVLPDPATNRSGTDEALRILRQPRMKSTFPFDAKTAALLKNIATLTPRRDYYPPHKKVMQTTDWNKNLGEMAQHDDFRSVVQEIIDHTLRFSAFYNIKKENITIIRGDQELLDRARFRHAQFQCSEFGGSIGYPRPPGSIYSARDRGQPSSRSVRVYEVTALIRDWPSSTQQCEDLVLRAARWDHVCMSSHEFCRKGLANFLKLSIQDAWVALYNLCQTSNREKDTYYLISVFGTFAFGGRLELSDIRLLLAIAFSGQFQDLSVPGNSNPHMNLVLQLDKGKELNKSEIRSAIEKHYEHFKYRPTKGILSLIKCKEERKQQENEYRQRKMQEVDACLEIVMAQWPCEQPHLSAESLSRHFDRQKVLEECGRLFGCWYQNKQFFDFVQQVQSRLNVICASSLGHLPVEPIPALPVGGPARPEVPFQPPTLLELIRSSVPIKVPPDIPQLTCPRPQIPQCCFASRDLELRSLVHSAFEGANDHRWEYEGELLKSLDALETTCLPYYPPTIPISRDILVSYQARLRQRRDMIWSSLISALTSTDSAWKSVSITTLWPSITVSAVLSFLAVDKWPLLPETWKHVILGLAKVIAALRRCDRLVALFNKNDVNGFCKEAEAACCEGWNALESPDWVLFEIENDLTIRPLQAEVARMMIGAGESSALQLNMGEGKTSVITPIVVSRLTDSPHTPRVIVLKPLLRQSTHLLSQRLGGLLNRPVYYIPFSRNTPMDERLVSQLQSIYHCCQEQKGILIALPEQILSFRLIGLDIAHESSVTARKLVELEQWLQSNCRNIVDECDEVLNPRFQLVYAMGKQQSLDGHSDRWGITQAVLTVVGEQAVNLHLKDPTLLDIECDGPRYPLLHLLKEETIDVLLENVLEAISNKQLPGVPFETWQQRIRESALRFIRCSDVSDSDQSTLRETFQAIVMRRLLVLRGLFAHQILRFALADKRWLVDYGLDQSRCLMAVPFRAKGVPSDSSEFGHPDVALTLTCLSYYYEGLTKDQIRQCFSLIVNENDPATEYQRWIVKCRDVLPEGLEHLTGVNLEDTLSFQRDLYPHLRYQKGIIDFYLSCVVFPREAKEFPWKLSTSAWDLPSQPNLPPTTGFSGTNDNRSLLPLSMPQHDLPHLLHTNAMVLSHLLLEENRQCVLAQDSSGRQLRTNELISLVNRQDPPIRVIVDVGAQILDRSNRGVAENWLSALPQDDTDAAVFYDDTDEAMVIDREGHAERLLASTFRRRMGRCVIFLDQHHARGVDLKLPLDYRAAITLGPRLAKDRLVQACNRMRELGNGQSVVFFIPPEVSHSMTPRDGVLNSYDVIQWTLQQTCHSLESFRPLWAWQGLHHHRRMRLWNALLANENVPSVIVQRMQEPEAQTLLQLYAPWEIQASLPEDNSDLDQSNPEVHYLLDIWRNAIKEDTRGHRLHEEQQEREIAVEVEKEQHLCRPRAVKPLKHTVDPDIRHFVKHGKFPSKGNSAAVYPAFESLRWTSAGQFNCLLNLGSHLYATLDFTETVHRDIGYVDDEYLKPVHWILSNSHNEDLLILSQYEANELLPDIQRSKNTALHIYTPRTTKGMHTFHRLDFLTIGQGKTNVPPTPEISRDLEFFAGSLYFDSFSAYQHFYHFLGLKTSAVADIPEESTSPEGFVDEETRQAQDWPVRSPFRSNPLPFLSAVFDIRGKGHGYLETDIGSIVKGMPLPAEWFEADPGSGDSPSCEE